LIEGLNLNLNLNLVLLVYCLFFQDLENLFGPGRGIDPEDRLEDLAAAVVDSDSFGHVEIPFLFS
jgi:hypothetical protein